MSRDFIVTLEIENDFRIYAIVTCEGEDFNENRVTNILPIDIFFTEKGGKVELKCRLTLKQFEKEWGLNWKVMSVGSSLTDFMIVIAPVVRPFKEDDWKPTRELTVDDFESVDE